MRLAFARFGLVLAILASAAAGQSPPAAPPLEIVTESLPRGVLRYNYHFQVQATGGTGALQWLVAGGTLPPGIDLDGPSGVLSGVPKGEGEYRVTFEVRDSSKPPWSRRRDFLLKVVPPLIIQWKSPAWVNGSAIEGSVRVSNATPDDFDLTFIALAVNEIGKAFVLGYQHVTLAARVENQEIAFGSTLPAGRYVVHVDAVAEVPAKNAIYRARLQTATPLETQ